jgi:hypothetical protein
MDPKLEAVKPEDFPKADYRRPVNYEVNYDTDNVQMCVTIFRRFPWMLDTVSAVLIDPVNIPATYYNEYSPRIEDGVEFFPVLKSYYTMRCKGKVVSVSSQTDELTVEFQNQLLVFRVGIVVKGKLVVQNKEMFEEEAKYIEDFRNSGVDIAILKRSKPSDVLKSVAVSALEEYMPNADDAVVYMQRQYPTAYAFAKAVSKITTCAKLDPITRARLSKSYYDVSVVSTFDLDTLLPSVTYNAADVEDYIQDSATNMILYAEKYNDIPTRKYLRQTKRVPRVQNIDNIKFRCKNSSDARTILDENLIFYEEFCFNVETLYHQFKEGNNYTNPYTNEPFEKSFVDKVVYMYAFKRERLPALVVDAKVNAQAEVDDEYDQIIHDLYNKKGIGFDSLYVAVKKEIEALISGGGGGGATNIVNKCEKCAGVLGNKYYKTIGVNGAAVKFCSEVCMREGDAI